MVRGKISKYANIIIESINYIVINYALSNMALFFHSGLLLFYASELWLMGKYWKNILDETKSKLITIILTVCCFCVHIGMVYFIGYVSGTLTHFGNI